MMTEDQLSRADKMRIHIRAAGFDLTSIEWEDSP